MIRKNRMIISRANQILDIVQVMACYAFASWFWLVVQEGDVNNMAMINKRTLFVACIYAVVLSLFFMALGFYRITRTRKIIWRLGIIFLGTTITVLVATFLLYLFRLQEFSRGVLFLFYGTTIATLSIKYILVWLVLRWIRKRGYNIRHEVVIGTGQLAQHYSADVKKSQEMGLHILGFIGPRRIMRPMGGYEKLDEILSRPDIDEVIIALEPEEYGKIREMIAACDKNGIKYFVLPFYNDIIPDNPVIESVGGSKLINVRWNRLEDVGWAALKRAFDIFACSVGLILLSPLMIGIAIGVKLSSPGPVFFRQVRVGYKRKAFTMLKFRSMMVHDEEKDEWTKQENDRRTRFGSLIRHCSLDELPQFFNVLIGNMTLVGPRPELPRYVEQFKEKIPLYMVKHQVKPGITGWAQVNGLRGDTNIQERVKYDLWYIENWSVGLDLKIMFKTVFGGMINNEVICKRASNKANAKHSPSANAL